MPGFNRGRGRGGGGYRGGYRGGFRGGGGGYNPYRARGRLVISMHHLKDGIDVLLMFPEGEGVVSNQT